uniref:Uncharacterized protein n=1 Tax=Aegilops tauschii subsp. strangulata TaxID=200361 RepID=A0A453FT55_AEGTS
MIFRAPLFADPSDRTTFQQLETSLWKELGLRPGAVFLSDVLFSSDDYLQVQVSLFPSTGTSFATSELIRIGFAFSNQTYKPPSIFGPYYFIGDTYVSFSGIQHHQCKLCPYLHKKFTGTSYLRWCWQWEISNEQTCYSWNCSRLQFSSACPNVRGDICYTETGLEEEAQDCSWLS